MPGKPEIPQKPVMSVEAAAYPKLFKIYHKSHSAYIAYREQEAEWEKIYGTDSQKQDKESILERLKNPPKVTTEYQQQKTGKSKDRQEQRQRGKIIEPLFFDRLSYFLNQLFSPKKSNESKAWNLSFHKMYYHRQSYVLRLRV